MFLKKITHFKAMFLHGNALFEHIFSVLSKSASFKKKLDGAQ